MHNYFGSWPTSHMATQGSLGSVAFLFRDHIPGETVSVEGRTDVGAESRTIHSCVGIVCKVFSGYSGSSKS